MLLKNKKTGEIIEFDALLPVKDVAGDSVAHLEYGSLAELNEEWTDVPEEPKGYYYINTHLHSVDYVDNTYENKGKDQEIGNYFSSREEAELAVRKLKAWKRLKEDLISLSWQPERDGEFSIWGRVNSAGIIKADAILDNHRDDLDLLFGGEE